MSLKKVSLFWLVAAVASVVAVQMFSQLAFASTGYRVRVNQLLAPRMEVLGTYVIRQITSEVRGQKTVECGAKVAGSDCAKKLILVRDENTQKLFLLKESPYGAESGRELVSSFLVTFEKSCKSSLWVSKKDGLSSAQKLCQADRVTEETDQEAYVFGQGRYEGLEKIMVPLSVGGTSTITWARGERFPQKVQIQEVNVGRFFGFNCRSSKLYELARISDE